MTTIQKDWAQEAWAQTVAKVGKTSKRIGDGFPHASVGGEYKLEPAYWWTAGFWPGLLWLLYRDTKDEGLKQLAESCEQQLDQVVTDYYRLDHDIGFMWTLTSVARYKLLGADDSKRRALLAANLLAARFNVKGKLHSRLESLARGRRQCRLGDHRLHDESAVAALGCADHRRPALQRNRRQACRHGG